MPSLAPSSHWEFSMGILKLNMMRAPEMASIFDIWELFHTNLLFEAVLLTGCVWGSFWEFYQRTLFFDWIRWGQGGFLKIPKASVHSFLIIWGWKIIVVIGVLRVSVILVDFDESDDIYIFIIENNLKKIRNFFWIQNWSIWQSE